MEIVLNGPQLSCPVSDASHVAAARRAAADLGARQGFDATRAGELAIVITEAATNILKHAGRGEILLRALRSGNGASTLGGVEVLALDSGPGMPNLAASLRDGHTTAGSYGVGLGAMRRLSASFDAFSAPGQGSALYMALWATPPPLAGPGLDAPLDIGVVCLPMHGETVCGDAWGLAWDATSATVLVADGLGHGPLAADASQAAVRSTMDQPAQAPGLLLEDAHAALRATRGAAVAAIRIDMLREELLHAGVGNIACHLWGPAGRRQLVSHNGIVGSNMRKIQEFTAPWDQDSMLLLHSDGLATRWGMDDYRGLAACHPAVVAAVLYRDFARGRDDVTVLVLRARQGSLP